jgi:polysaccharide export outer membrane protein
MSRKTVSKSIHQGWKMVAVALLCATIIQMGCLKAVQDFFKTDKDRFLDASKVIHATDASPINPIRGSASEADPEEDLLPNSEFPKESDYIYSDADYVIGPNDVLDISILDLYQPGMETTIRRQVEASGFIDLPLLTDRVQADGFNANTLKQRIADVYSQTLLRNPQVSVSVVARRQSTFSILGSVLNPGTYEVTRSDMRLLDAIAMARGITAPTTTVRYIYIIRPEPAVRASDLEGTGTMVLPTRGSDIPELPETSPDAGPLPSQLPDLPLELPEEDTEGDESSAVEMSQSVLTYLDGLEGDAGLEPEREMRFVNGQWVEVNTSGKMGSFAYLSVMPTETNAMSPEVAEATLEADVEGQMAFEGDYNTEDPWGWEESNKSELARVIAINLRELLDGDPRMNVIIRDNDIVRVPTVEAGEFYIMGEVTRPGVYSLTGRRLTVKMAMAAAGNLGPLAWPENSILIRRIGENQEQIIPIDIEKIFTGEESDLFLKGNDVIAVGTNAAASFMAVVRNAFRMTYGFGFIYDRNFADPYPALGLDSKRFTRW